MNARAIAGLTLLLAVFVATSGSSAAMLRPLTVGWENYFTIDWTTGVERGRPIVHGHIRNTWGFAATNVRLLVEGVNDRGEVLGQTIGWLGTQLTPGTTAPFEVPIDGQAPSYRVSVFAFDWLQRGRGLN